MVLLNGYRSHILQILDKKLQQAIENALTVQAQRLSFIYESKARVNCYSHGTANANIYEHLLK